MFRFNFRESGELIKKFKTYEEAKEKLESYERGDKMNGDYEEDFYEIVEA